MKQIPIIFSTPMVQAILAGRKNMTRRVVKFKNKSWRLSYEANEPDRTDLDAFGVLDKDGNLIEIEEGQPSSLKELELCPYGKPGDILWVRETWLEEAIPKAPEGDYDEIIYRFKASEEKDKATKWCPSIHMPKEAARIWLQVTDVRVERLQDITEEDAMAEGVKPAHCESTEGCPSRLCKDGCTAKGEWWNYMEPNGEGFPAYSAKESFETLWQSINGPESWEANPWVWVVSFEIGKPDLSTLRLKQKLFQ